MSKKKVEKPSKKRKTSQGAAAAGSKAGIAEKSAAKDVIAETEPEEIKAVEVIAKALPEKEAPAAESSAAAGKEPPAAGPSAFA